MNQKFVMGQTVEHSRSKETLLFEVVDGVSAEMIRKTYAKFDAWDAVLEKKTLEEGTEEEIKYAYSLLQDPTIYAYARQTATSCLLQT